MVLKAKMDAKRDIQAKIERYSNQEHVILKVL